MKKLQLIFTSIFGLFLMAGFTNASILSSQIVNSAISKKADSDKVLKTEYNDYSKTSFICGNSSYGCSSSRDIFQVKYDDYSKKYFICGNDRSSCSSSNSIFQIKDGYLCPKNSSCTKTTSITTRGYVIQIEAILSAIEGYSSHICRSNIDTCTWDEAALQVKKDGDIFYVCDGDEEACNKSYDFLQIKKDGDTYHMCDGKVVNCNKIYDFIQIKKDGDTYYMCDSEVVNCNEIYDFLQVKKDGDYYHICGGDVVNCNKTNSILWIKKSKNNYFTCEKRKDYCDSEEAFVRTRLKDTSSSNSSNSTSNDELINQIVMDIYSSSVNECQSLFGTNSTVDPDDYNYCICKDGYTWNNAQTACIKIETNNNTISNQNNWESSSTNTSNYSGYPKDYRDAYAFAYQNKITTMPTIEEANMDGEIIRAEIAKMLANWVKSLGKTPDTSKSCNFKDISGVKGDLYTAVIESCQLGIMGQGINEFRPFDKITKGEVSTAVSRILWGNMYDGGEPFYLKHMNALKDIGVLNNIYNPDTNELRGNVMVMLMKASGSDSDEPADCEDPAVLLACSLGDPDCPVECAEEEEEEEIDIDALVEEILNGD